MNVSLRRLAFSGFAVWMAVLALSLYFLMPLKDKIRLGIDLVGGTYITLEVQTEKAVEAALLDKMDATALKLKTNKIAMAGKPDVKNDEIILNFKSLADAQAAATALKNEHDLTLNSSGSTLKMSFTDRAKKGIEQDAVLRNIEVLRTRLDKFSVSEIPIASHGEKNIVIELPSVSDPQQAKAMIGTAAILEFKLVERVGKSEEDIRYEYDGMLPIGTQIVPGARDEDGHQSFYLVSKRASVTGKDLKHAQPKLSEERGDLVVAFSLTPEGGQRFHELTSKNYKRVLAAVLDGVVITAATIDAAIKSEGYISRHGGYHPDEARELATLLKSGSFVAPVTFEEERQVGPTLGQEAIRQGIISCGVGLVLLFLFSVFFYKTAGLFAFATLLYNLVLILVGMACLKATLTLPGIAGMVLTVGMAIDASILIYERIKEELAIGIPLRKAVNDGFSDAMRVILDANITTFIVGFVLYYFGSGPIKGFAVTMMLGIVATVITGLFFLKSIFNVILDNFNVQKIKI